MHPSQFRTSENLIFEPNFLPFLSLCHIATDLIIILDDERFDPPTFMTGYKHLRLATDVHYMAPILFLFFLFLLARRCISMGPRAA